MNNDILLGWTASGAPVHLDDVQADPLALRELKRATPAGAVALLVVHAVAPRFFDGAPIRRPGDDRRSESHYSGVLQ